MCSASRQDRLLEKSFIAERGIAVPAFRPVSIGAETLADALEEIGRPAVLKSRRLGYDGKGQAIIRDGDDVEAGVRGDRWRCGHH